MADLQDPVFDPPSRLVWNYYKHADGAVTTDQATDVTKNVAVMANLDYVMETGEYSRKISCHKTQPKMRGNNNAKGYTLVLQHYSEELQAKPKNQEAWWI